MSRFLPRTPEPHADRRLEARLSAAAAGFRERPSDGLRERILAGIDARPRQPRRSRWQAKLALAATITVLVTLAAWFVLGERTLDIDSRSSVSSTSPTAIAAALPNRLGELASESSDALRRTVSQPLRSELDALVFDASNLADAIFGRMTKPLRSLVVR